jgi:hypothetical protein
MPPPPSSVEDTPVAVTANVGVSGTANVDDAQLSAWLPSVREQLLKLSTQVAEMQQSAQFGLSQSEIPRAEASMLSPAGTPGGNASGFAHGGAGMSSSTPAPKVLLRTPLDDPDELLVGEYGLEPLPASDAGRARLRDYRRYRLGNKALCASQMIDHDKVRGKLWNAASRCNQGSSLTAPTLPRC